MEWKPNSGPQTLALSATDYEVGYGGRRGGGKTAAGIVWLLYDKEHPLYRALVIRKNAEDLNDWTDRAKRIYEPLGAVMTGKPAQFVFPSGAIIRTGHLKDENAYGKYQGHEYQKELVEELTQIPSEESYLKLVSSCRSTIPEIKPQVFSTFNPDGPGFAWVKKRFRLVGIPKEPVRTIDPQTGLSRVFIPAGLQDNPFLDKDPQYRSFLNGLPDGLRQAWRDGSWDDPIIKGAYYTAEVLQARREGRIRFTPYDPRLKVHTVWDLGIDDAMSIGFWQKTGTDIRIINYYQNENEGLPHYITRLQEFREKYNYVYGLNFAPFDIKKRELSTGKMLLQTAEELHLKFEVVPSIGIMDGIQLVRLMFPRLYISEGPCDQFLNGITNYRREWDEDLLKYKDNAVKDWTNHPSDMLRYTAISEDKMTNEDFEQERQQHNFDVRQDQEADVRDMGV
jgi:hypothetical protein